MKINFTLEILAIVVGAFLLMMILAPIFNFILTWLGIRQ